MLGNLLVEYQTVEVGYGAIALCGHKSEVLGDHGLVTLLDGDEFWKHELKKGINTRLFLIQAVEHLGIKLNLVFN